MPELPDWQLGVWRAWHRLHIDRPWMGGGLGPVVPGRIAWRDVVSWCEYQHVADDDVPFYDACIRAMDDEYLAWWRGQQPTGGK